MEAIKQIALEEDGAAVMALRISDLCGAHRPDRTFLGEEGEK